MEPRFRDYCQTLRPRLDTAIGQTLRGLFHDLPTPARAPVQATFQDGKMLRGVLVCLVGESLGGTLEAAIPRSVAVELIHGATLLHDDFVDQDRIRRHKPAAWTLTGARQAVLLGDVIFASAIAMMSELGREDGISVSRAIARLAKGACQEPSDARLLAEYLATHTLSERGYDTIIDLKTGVLFGTACELGAIAAGADSAVCRTCYRYGRLIGEAYQIADDVQDIRQALAHGRLDTRTLVALAPALLRFGEGGSARIAPWLGQKRVVLDDSLAREFAAVGAAMTQEQDRRLASACAEATRVRATPPWRGMLDHAPGEIIDMFSQS